MRESVCVIVQEDVLNGYEERVYWRVRWECVESMC